MQMIAVMDNLWKQEGLELCMTVYSVVPTQLDQGLIEFVQVSTSAFHSPSHAVALVLGCGDGVSDPDEGRKPEQQRGHFLVGSPHHTIRRFKILYLLTSWMAKATSAFKQNLLYRWLVTHNPGQVTVYISLTRLKFCFFSE